MLEVPEVPAPPLPLENGEVGTMNEQEEGEEPGLGKAKDPELLGKAKKDLAKRDSESVSVDSLGLPKMFNSKKAKADGGSSLEKDDPQPMSSQRPGMRLSQAMGYAEPKAKAKPKAQAVMKRPGMPGVKKSLPCKVLEKALPRKVVEKPKVLEKIRQRKLEKRMQRVLEKALPRQVLEKTGLQGSHGSIWSKQMPISQSQEHISRGTLLEGGGIW